MELVIWIVLWVINYDSYEWSIGTRSELRNDLYFILSIGVHFDPQSKIYFRAQRNLMRIFPWEQRRNLKFVTISHFVTSRTIVTWLHSKIDGPRKWNGPGKVNGQTWSEWTVQNDIKWTVHKNQTVLDFKVYGWSKKDESGRSQKPLLI